MPPSRIHKLITVFLILSAGTSSLVLIFLNFNSPTSSELALVTSTSLPTSSEGGALVEPLPSSSNFAAGIENHLPPLTPTSNMTEALAEHLAREVVKANPNGPPVALNGTPALNSLSTDVMDNLTSIVPLLAPTSTALFNETVSESDLHILTQYDQNALAEYASETIALYNSSLGSQEFSDITNIDPQNGLDPDTITGIQYVYDRAIAQARAMKVPAPFVKFHLNFLNFLIHSRQALEIAAEYKDDPLKAVIAASQGKDAVKKDLHAVFAELDKIPNAPPHAFLDSHDKGISFFGIPRAYAQVVPITDIFAPEAIISAIKNTLSALYNGHIDLTTAAHYAEVLWEWGKKIVTEELKNRLVHLLVQKIIAWVNNGFNGKPQFVDDWQGFLAGAANQAFGDALYNISPKLCSSFGPLLKIHLLQIQSPGNLPLHCTLDQVIGNIQQFYNNFETGGWVAFETGILPSNNYFGSIFEVSQVLESKAQAAKQAQNSQAVAASGFLSTERCSDGSAPQTYNQPVPVYEAGQPHTPDHIIQYNISTQGRCSDGLPPQTMTPGNTIAASVKKAVADSPIDQIVNAQDAVALISALVDSFINQMILAGVNGLRGAAGGYSPENDSLIAPGGPADRYRNTANCRPGTPGCNRPDRAGTASSSADTVPQSMINAVCAGMAGQRGVDCRVGLLACVGLPPGQKATCETQVKNVTADIESNCSLAPGDARDTCIQNGDFCAFVPVSNSRRTICENVVGSILSNQ